MSTATKKDLARWFDEGVKKHATHMIVVCDTFDYNDYPVYVWAGQDAREVASEYQWNDRKMTRVMEVYDLRRDRDEQLAEERVFNY